MNKGDSVNLSDYTPYPFHIPNINLNFLIYEEYVLVQSSMRIKPLNKCDVPLILKGVDLEIERISIQEVDLLEDDYNLISDRLIIAHPPSDPFDLNIVTRVYPYKNTSLEGLYLSENLLTTQCEAEGFRRICFHPDRPDVLSKYRTRVEADLEKYPILLSNGNQITASIIANEPSRHEVIWDDPYPKPSYLFALVAGKLEKVGDTFETKSGRNVSINIYVDREDRLFVRHAISSLKKAMTWDENKYGFEYDLTEYNIVAVRHFNMGAMENKSLNIFNSKLVLADSKTATDDELTRIESVIAHEYFHNWTGNRITCRDWFQLSFKEGLTVFRDQSFTSDLHSDAVKRIEDVSFLRNTQFLEDSGPTSHAVKPGRYFSIDNFYTTTIYEKGAELIRMLFILLTPKRFFKGIDYFVECFDGCAVTTEDFISSTVKGASYDNYLLNFDIDQFSKWYYQSGTPEVKIDREWNPTLGELTLKITQFNSLTSTTSNKYPLVIPIRIAFINSSGISGSEKLLILDQNKQDFTFKGLTKTKDKPILSIFRAFSAPVKWQFDYSTKELFHLFRFDDDPFARWNAGQDLMKRALISRASNTPKKELENNLAESFSHLLTTFDYNDLELLFELLSLPRLPELELAQSPTDPIGLYKARLYLEKFLGQSLVIQLRHLTKEIKSDCDFPWPQGLGARKMLGLAWRWLALSGDIEVRREALEAVSGNSMSLSRAALNALQPVESEEREIAMNNFYNLWKDRPVILDTWFALEASTPRKDALNNIRKLITHHRFDPTAPNSLRSVLGGFSSNIESFHALDGSGYTFMANQIIEIDKRNPITASRLAKVFSRWHSYLPIHREEILKRILKISEQNLSSNTREVIELTLSK